MGFFTSVVDGLDAILDGIGSTAKQGFADYCDLETVDDLQTLVSQDGSLATVVEIQGTQRLRGSQTMVDTIHRLTSSLQSMFERKAHMMQAFFEVDPDRTRDQIQIMQSSARKTATRLNLDMEDLLDERETNLVKWVSAERCFFVLWTTPSSLVKSERKTEQAARSERIKGKVVTKHSQNPLAAVSMIRNRHASFVDTVVRELGSLGIMGVALDAKRALREIRMTVDPAFTGPEWEPALPGDVCLPSQRTNKISSQEWEIMWPRMGWQLCPRDAKIIDNNVVEVGDRIYSPLYIDLFQKDSASFMGLFGRAMEKSLPWRISFLIEGGGLDDFRFKGMAASLMGMVGAGNKAVDRAVKELTHMQNVNKTTIVQIRACLCTWAPRGQRELLTRRSSDLARCIESWGSCQVSEVTGDPVAGFVSTVPGFTTGSIGTKSAAPMDEAMLLLPLSRPSSPWDYGSVLFRSPDGKIMPFEPYSSRQSRWISLIFAPPGSGKSVLMNSLNLALCMAPINQALPRIAIIDIGPSSSGLISLLKAALPPERRHEAVHKRLRMVERDAINPFDTQLGCRYPTSLEMAFLRNFLTLLMTEPGEENPPAGMSSLVPAVLEEMYLMRSDKQDAKLYAAGMVPEVDEAIREARISVDSRTTWWEVVDDLFRFGNRRAAQIAQRHAVPILADAVTAVQNEKVKVSMGDIRNEATGENLIGSFTRQVATILNIYPILARPTAFDLGDARVAALDLDEVAKTGGPQADRQTAVLYMMARQIMAKDYYINKDVVTDMPAPPQIELRATVPVQEYRSYHLARIEDLMASPKRICYDEFHRTSKSSLVREQVLVDMREGRKFQVDVMLASQSLIDFDPRMMEFASSVYVMDKGNAEAIEEIGRRFGFDDPEEKYAIERRVHPPGGGRAGVFLVKHQTTLGDYTMLLVNQLGPIELWAFSTTAEDASIRNKLYERLGPKLARQALAQAFPRGSAKAEVEERREKLKDRVTVLDEKDVADILGQIIEEVVILADRLRMMA